MRNRSHGLRWRKVWFSEAAKSAPSRCAVAARCRVGSGQLG